MSFKYFLFVISLITSTHSFAKVDDTKAKNAAISDGITTLIGISQGATEANPLVNTSPIGILGLTALKFALINNIKESDISETEKSKKLNDLYGLWGGLSVNNLLITLGAPSGVAIPLGLGFYLNSKQTNNIKNEYYDFKIIKELSLIDENNKEKKLNVISNNDFTNIKQYNDGNKSYVITNIKNLDVVTVLKLRKINSDGFLENNYETVSFKTSEPIKKKIVTYNINNVLYYVSQ